MSAIVQQILGEAEGAVGENDSHVETRSVVRNQASLNNQLAVHFKLAGRTDTGEDTGFSIGSREFERDNGVWYEIRRRRNPAYYSKPDYRMLYGDMGGAFTMLFLKSSKLLKRQPLLKAIKAITHDFVGAPVPWRDIYCEGADPRHWDDPSSIKKARTGSYEVNLDGTFKRIK